MDFASVETINKLKCLYETYRKEHEMGAKVSLFHSTQDSQNAELAKKIDKEIRLILGHTLAENFKDYKIVLGAFLVKEPGSGSIVPPHQDWNWTDEQKYFSCNVWIPLSDTGRINGGLRVVPSSHRIIPTIRPNYNYTWAFEDVVQSIEAHLIDVDTQVGECVLIDHSVIHASYANLASTSRVAAIVTIVPKEANLYHFFCEDGQTVEKYPVETEDIYHMRYKVKPEYLTSDVSFDYDFPRVNETVFQEWIKNR